MRRVGVVTVARSDYGIYRPLLRELERRDDVELRLYVGGSHLSERFGSTVREIEADGFPIAERVDFLLPEDTPLAVAQSIGRGVSAFAEAFVRSSVDVIVLLGDRFEMLAAGIAALPLGVPLAHIHGGERTEGLIDEAIRHSLTKLSHLHFASTPEHARRIIQLGEQPDRVLVTGAPGLDAIRCATELGDDDLAALGVRLRGPTLLVTYHPVTLEHDRTAERFDALLQAVASAGLDAVFTYPNADTRHGAIVERLERLAADDRYTLVRNLGSDAYFALLRRVVAMVGNSSSGIIEAASFELPVVDVGARQQGRLRERNVVHAEEDAESIAAALRTVLAPGFRAGLAGLVNPYGDGHAGERIAEVLATVPLAGLVVKRFHDL